MRRCGGSELKLLLISPYYEDGKQISGGIVNWTKNFICNPIVSSQIKISIVNTRLIGGRALGSDKYSYFDESYRFCWNVVSLLIQLILKKPDIVHLNTSCSNFGLIRDSIFSSIVKFFNKPLVVHFHCDVAYYSYSQRAFLCLSKLVQRADTLFVLNKPSQKFILEEFGEKSEILPLYIPNDKLKQIVQRKVEDTIKCIIFVGHVTENKGCDIILKLAEMIPQVKIILIGHVFEEFIAKYEIPNNVVLTGNLPHSQVETYLRKADLFLFPSKTEGFPTAVLEAMAFGLPIIASGVGAIPEMIGTNGEGGIIVESQSSVQFCNAIQKLNTSVNLRQTMSEWNIIRVNQFYNDSVVLKTMLLKYQALISKNL